MTAATASSWNCWLGSNCSFIISPRFRFRVVILFASRLKIALECAVLGYPEFGILFFGELLCHLVGDLAGIVQNLVLVELRKASSFLTQSGIFIGICRAAWFSA